jgi:PAS domain S-box-containing protein
MPDILTRLFPWRHTETEQQRTEDLARVNAQLRGQSEWFRVILASIADAVIVTDTDGHIVFLNPVAEVLTGHDAASATGRPLPEVFTLIPAEGLPEEESPVYEAMRDSVVLRQGHHLLVTRSGQQVPIDDSTAPIRDDKGRTLGAVVVFHDITARRRAEEERELLVRQLEKERAHLTRAQVELCRQAEELAMADKRKDEFLAMLAHELRNPLAPIRNALHVLRMRADQPQMVAWGHDVVDRQVRHMTRIIDDLLDVSRISRGKIQLHVGRVDLTRLVRDTAEDHRGAVEAAGLKLHVETETTPIWVQGDGTRLAQVLGNLLHNAIKFTDAGGTVTVRLRPSDDGRAVVTVCDTGIGVEPQLLQRIFDPFTQADRSLDRSRGGLGLGLALVRGLIELHGGTVTAESAGAGQGTSVTFLLPLVVGDGSEPHPAPPPPGQARRLHILVVEDNRDTAETMRLFFGLAGHCVEVAHTGPEGVDKARLFHPDVVLCDLGLPELDGFEVARALRAEPATSKVRLIAVSGYGQAEDRRRATEAGFDLHLTKPVDPRALQTLLESA